MARSASSILLAIAATLTASCSPEPRPPKPAYDRYIEGQRDYIAGLKELPQLAAEIDRAKAIVAGMTADRIERIDALDYPLLIAAGSEVANRSTWTTQGTDWSRYATPHGCCRSVAESSAIRARTGQALCGDSEFRTVRGAVARSGRYARTIPGSVAGIVASGDDEYRGTLVTGRGERLAIVWTHHWFETPGDRRANDPLDDAPHLFHLRRLASARYWTVATWSDRSDPPRDPPYLDYASCIAAIA